MGLDTVELVMAIESEFAIEIPDAEAEKMECVGDTYDFVLKSLRESAPGGVIDEARVWERLREIIVEQLGVRPEQVTLEASFVYDLGAD